MTMTTTAGKSRVFARIEDLNRRVWGDKITLATSSHVLGGVGLGLLLGRVEGRRSLAYALLASSLAAHLYAWLTKTPVGKREMVRKLETGLDKRAG